MLLSVTARGPGAGRRAFKSWLHHQVAVRPQASDLSPLSHSGHVRPPAASWAQTSVCRADGSMPGPGAWGRWAPSLGGCVPALEWDCWALTGQQPRGAEAVPLEPHFPTKGGSDHGPESPVSKAGDSARAARPAASRGHGGRDFPLYLGCLAHKQPLWSICCGLHSFILLP